MASTKSNKRSPLVLHALQVAAVVACVAGVAVLLLPLFEIQFRLITATPATLNNFGWMALAFGVVLLVLEQLIKAAHKATGEPLQTPKANWRHRKATTAGFASAARSSSTSTPTLVSGAAAVVGDSSSRPEVWSAEVLDNIEWRRFEAVCEALFAQPGLEVQSQSHGPEGGVAIWLYTRGVEGSVTIVKCKQSHGKEVDVRELRTFLGGVASHQLKRGTYATTETFSAAARQFAEANGIKALDGADLLKMISARSPEEQQALLREAFDGDYWRPMCANCGVKMVERTGPQGGARFWGCSTYPHCKLRLPMVDKLRQLSLLVE